MVCAPRPPRVKPNDIIAVLNRPKASAMNAKANRAMVKYAIKSESVFCMVVSFCCICVSAWKRIVKNKKGLVNGLIDCIY